VVEVHSDVEAALSDGEQSLTPEGFREMMDDLRGLCGVLGRRLVAPSLMETVG
jgi:3-deoxy-7-phosphoheptulonate synthase